MLQSRYKSYLNKGRRRVYLFLLLVLVIVSIPYFYIEKNIRPKIIAISEIRARLIATKVINEAVSEKIARGSFDNLLDIKTDNTGKVSVVQANTVEMNRLAVETSIAVQKELEEMKARRIRIPLGDVFGSQIFADYGPSFNISILPEGSVGVDFTTEFIEAGINQTRLKIYLIVKTRLQIIIPFASEQTDVSISIPVSETIIVGDVPESYIRIPRNEDNEFLRIVPD